MRPQIRHAFVFLILTTSPAIRAADELKGAVALVESSLATDSKQIRQFAFDGDPETYFASSINPHATDYFTLTFDKPIALKSVVVTTGKPDGSDKLEAGSLQVSSDGKAFEDAAKFADGSARYEAKDKSVQAIRIKPTSDMTHPLILREIVVDSSEPVATFHYPVEFTVDVTDAPEMKEWAEGRAALRGVVSSDQRGTQERRLQAGDADLDHHEQELQGCC